LIVPILPSSPDLYEAAAHIATAFDLPLIDSYPIDSQYFLYLTPDHLALHNGKNKPIFVDFVKGRLGYRRQHGGGRKQALGRAIGLKNGVNPSVMDATAGLGRDAFVLAHLGCHMTLIERSPTFAALLQDGLQRAPFLQSKMQLIHADAREQLRITNDELREHESGIRNRESGQENQENFDVIYVDPMYPHRRKSALVKKEMRFCREIVGEDEDAPALLEIALQCARQRVVVKRPKFAPTLNERLPTFTISSKNTRFDVYLTNP